MASQGSKPIDRVMHVPQEHGGQTTSTPKPLLINSKFIIKNDSLLMGTFH
jgi:hypothetical protein